MTIDKNNEGAWRICENINGYLETKVYYFYTKKDAIKKFKEYKKNLINQQKGTMKTQKTCPDCNDYLYQDQMSSDLICHECETCFEKDFDEDKNEND